VIGGSILLGLLLGGASIVGTAGAAERCAGCVTAGAAYAALRVPAGTPLAGYGGMQRRLLFPDIFDRYAHAFWFRPSVGEHDPVAARALVLDSRATRLAWVTLDLIAVDRSFTRAVQDRLTRAGVPAATLIVSASHTHSGPGAFMDSELRGLIALDRLDPVVREALVEGVVTAVRRADGGRVPALVAATRVTAPAVTTSRLGRPLDSEIVVVKVTGVGGEPLALVWNFAIHGTMLPAGNLHLSGDVMGVASALLERKLGAPALFVNGAVGDVSPAGHGMAALRDTAGASRGARSRCPSPPCRSSTASVDGCPPFSPSPSVSSCPPRLSSSPPRSETRPGSRFPVSCRPRSGKPSSARRAGSSRRCSWPGCRTTTSGTSWPPTLPDTWGTSPAPRSTDPTRAGASRTGPSSCSIAWPSARGRRRVRHPSVTRARDAMMAVRAAEESGERDRATAWRRDDGRARISCARRCCGGLRPC